MSDVTQLEGRVTRLEEQISEGLLRIENLLRQTVTDLKTEQIAAVKEEIRLLREDQRRIWDTIHAMQLHDSQRAGGNKMLGAIGHFVSAGLGGFVTWLFTWLSGGGPPAHHP